MMNHGTVDQFNAKYSFNVETGIIVTAIDDIAEGNEILISYHDRPDDDLLMVRFTPER